MKRIEHHCLFFVLSTFILASCSIIKPNHFKTKNTYIYTKQFKAMHHVTKYHEKKNRERRNIIPASFGDPMNSTPENSDIYDDLLNDYMNLVMSGSHYSSSGSNILAHVKKCCDPDEEVPECGDDLCPCYEISADFQYILSNEPLLEFIILDTQHDTIIAQADTLSVFEHGGIYHYSIDIDLMIPNILYDLTFKIWDNENSEVKIYSAHIAIK